MPEYYEMPKALFWDDRYGDLSVDAKLLYAILRERVPPPDTDQNGYDANGRAYIYFHITEIMEMLRVRRSDAKRFLRELEAFQLIEREREPGKPAKIYVAPPPEFDERLQKLELDAFFESALDVDV